MDAALQVRLPKKEGAEKEEGAEKALQNSSMVLKRDLLTCAVLKRDLLTCALQARS